MISVLAVRGVHMELIEKIQHFLPTSTMRGILLSSTILSGVIQALPIPPIFDLKSYTEGTIWTLRLLLSVSVLLIGAALLIILLVKYCQKLKTTIISKKIMEREAKIIELEQEISSLKNELMIERQRNSIPTIDP